MDPILKERILLSLTLASISLFSKTHNCVVLLLFIYSICNLPARLKFASYWWGRLKAAKARFGRVLCGCLADLVRKADAPRNVAIIIVPLQLGLGIVPVQVTLKGPFLLSSTWFEPVLFWIWAGSRTIHGWLITWYLVHTCIRTLLGPGAGWGRRTFLHSW